MNEPAPLAAPERRQLGESDLFITPLGFGAWALGGDLGQQRDEESIAAIHRALELGVNWVDTAPAYGAGRSEEVVARAIRGLAEKPFIFTKCGDMPLDGRRPLRNLKAASIRHEVETSLRRLEVEAIDLCQIHQACPDDDIEEAVGTLASLQSQGDVRHIGVSNFDRAQLQRARAVATVTSIQPPYSMLTGTPFWEPPFHLAASTEALEHDILPFCKQEGIGVIVYSPLEQGLLAGSMSRDRVAGLGDDDWRRHDPRFTEPRLSRTLSLVDRLQVVAGRHKRSIGELAVAWVLHNPAVTGAIIGFRRAAQVDALAGACSFRLSTDDRREIETLLASA